MTAAENGQVRRMFLYHLWKQFFTEGLRQHLCRVQTAVICVLAKVVLKYFNFSKLASVLIPLPLISVYFFAIMCYPVGRFYFNIYHEIQDLYSYYSGVRRGMWVAVMNGDIVGCMSVDMAANDRAELKRMVVSSKFRRRGFASQMISWAIEFAKREGYREISVGTSSFQRPAELLYRKHGFIFYKEELFWAPMFECVDRYFLMRL